MNMHTTQFRNISSSNISKSRFSKFTIASALFLTCYTLPAMAADSFTSDSWQDPAAQAFNKLDTSGNGLLLPNEASKGKAFNKKTFKQADTDNDGSIDQNEYVAFKTGKSPEMAKPAAAPMKESVTKEKMMKELDPEAAPDKAMPEKMMPEEKELPMAE
jgi:EF hand